MRTNVPGCPGTGWTYPQTWDGVTGSYARSGLPAPAAGDVTSLDILADPTAANENTVPFTRSVQSGGKQQGNVQLVAANAMVGPLALFSDANGKELDSYNATYIKRSKATGEITSICLARDGKPWTAAFTMTRVGP